MSSSSDTNIDYHHHHNTMFNIYTNTNNNNSLQIKEDDKFFSRLLSKESSKAMPSSRRLYYVGLPGSVPFLWESEPGTPKKTLFHDQLRNRLAICHAADHDDHHHIHYPPLTPPPSFFSNKNENLNHNHIHHKRSRSFNILKYFNFGYNALMVRNNKQGQLSSVSQPSNGLESSSMIDHHHSHSLSCSPTTPFRARSASVGSNWFSSSSSSTTSFDDSRGEEEEELGFNSSPNSTLCFFRCYRR